MDTVFPLRCPVCGSDNIEYETNKEYTGGGFADTWYTFYCPDCGHEWRSETTSGYA